MILKTTDDKEEKQEQDQLKVIESLITALSNGDKELTKTIKQVFVEIRDKKPEKIDFSPLTALATEIKNQNQTIFSQNKVIIELLNRPDKETDNSDLIAAIKEMSATNKALLVQMSKPREKRTMKVNRDNFGNLINMTEL